jgi:Family of unknown function (DUF6302)
MNDRTPVTHVQDALGYQFYRDRLDDPGLLNRAVITEEGDLAVPAGGKRRGGYIAVDTKAAGKRLIRRLATRPDEFPDLRLIDCAPWVVEWGPELDWRGDDAGHPENWMAAGLYFGYSAAAIATYGRERHAGELPDPIARAKAQVVNEMDHLDESCRIGLDVGYAVKCFEEAVENFFKTLLGD